MLYNGILFNNGVLWNIIQQWNIYSSVSGHLGSFHLLAVVNIAAMNTDVQKVCVFSSFSTSPEVELLYYMLSLCLIF